MTNSCKIAEEFGKHHNQVLRDIRILLKKNPELTKHFFKGSYVSSRGKCYPNFLMDDTGADILANKFKYNVRSARFEYKYLNEIQDFLNVMKIKYIPQYKVNDYRIDLYIPKYNIAIEIDEEEHKYKRDNDLIRQKYIENQIHCKFIRVNEGESCGSVIARLTKELELTCFKSA